MFIDHTTNTVTSNTPTTATPFTIELNAITFEILSKDLYKDPIKAIIRELCCNATDAHTRANTQAIPFDIHLPTTHEPHFSIRDYGTGLSPENMEYLYTGYFKSDKRHTNSEIGGKGLGSKTPLAYSDNFIVNSYFNSQKHNYCIIKNEQGLPSLLHISSDTTNQPNGLEIIIAVNQNDITTFYEKAKLILPWMNYRLTNTLYPTEIPKIEILYSTPEFDLVKHEAINQPSILMGNIIYPIDLRLILSEHSIRWSIDELALIIKCPIGQIDITTSRDELHYTEKTTTSLKTILNNTIEKLKDYLSTKLNEQKTLQQAALWLNKFSIDSTGPNGRCLNWMDLRYFDGQTSLKLNVNSGIIFPNILNAYRITIGRKIIKWEKDSNFLYQPPNNTLYYSTNPINRNRINKSEDYSITTNTYLFHKTDSREEQEFLNQLNVNLIDVSHLFEPKIPKPRAKPNTQPTTHRKLHSLGEDTYNGNPPGNTFTLRKENNQYPDFPKWKPDNLYNYLTSWFDNVYITVTTKSTPKKSIPKNAPDIFTEFKKRFISFYQSKTDKELQQASITHSVYYKTTGTTTSTRIRNLEADKLFYKQFLGKEFPSIAQDAFTNLINSITPESFK